MKIGMIGYGSVGSGLGTLFSRAGHDVTAGVRDLARVPVGVRGSQIAEVVASSDALVLAVPFTAVESLAAVMRRGPADQIVIDATNPLGDNWEPLDLGAQNSAGEEVQRLLPQSRVVKAFNTIFADNLSHERLETRDRRISALIAGDDSSARATVLELAADAGFAPVEVGGISNARYLEAIAHLNIQLAVGMENGTNSGFVYFRDD